MSKDIDRALCYEAARVVANRISGADFELDESGRNVDQGERAIGQYMGVFLCAGKAQHSMEAELQNEYTQNEFAEIRELAEDNAHEFLDATELMTNWKEFARSKVNDLHEAIDYVLKELESGREPGEQEIRQRIDNGTR